MTSSARALLARLEVYRDATGEPSPVLPLPTGVLLARRAARSEQRAAALQSENDELRAQLLQVPPPSSSSS
ncbi:hypothetical protein DQ04_05641030 [Trypanosoma grayi]|uniref:hypothetical protein n=1 Tax=Trypanosoma grayi TaxID=71804 RepID=UPI0004F4BC5E|nr:hypothetical protein DQ04_05641030 [Trypanosoma grayi]KEG09193.1 hypothetical protein DQ04_05641030 [Trypanosoma grayi]